MGEWVRVRLQDFKLPVRVKRSVYHAVVGARAEDMRDCSMMHTSTTVVLVHIVRSRRDESRYAQVCLQSQRHSRNTRNIRNALNAG